MDVVLLVLGDGGQSASAAELGQRTGRQAAWVDDLRAAGLLKDGGHVDGPALRVRTAAGRPAVVDVPVALGIHSWLLLAVADMDAAVAAARSCPEAEFGDVRVLPLDPEGQMW